MKTLTIILIIVAVAVVVAPSLTNTIDTMQDRNNHIEQMING